MSLIGNLVFFVFGGFLIFLGYVLGGILLCLTIIGVPSGYKILKRIGGLGFRLFLLSKDMNLSYFLFAVAGPSIRG
jgi:uncharacterized membrane protein YccF (DUF307 family)